MHRIKNALGIRSMREETLRRSINDDISNFHIKHVSPSSEPRPPSNGIQKWLHYLSENRRKSSRWNFSSAPKIIKRQKQWEKVLNKDRKSFSCRRFVGFLAIFVSKTFIDSFYLCCFDFQVYNRFGIIRMPFLLCLYRRGHKYWTENIFVLLMIEPEINFKEIIVFLHFA